ncbi:peroxiredoxin [Oricola thermophila]|uniref:Glutathione-dependent peroxiredoxin n=1 Tax=Oricola thermophila TaxID=2742145 RepID=A0A6N1VI89_9HYPH|nr:peroxiredoxin [Oricola thermophila]QKV18869.1 peroxiredoxin [Oricola thermophila]
MPIKIGDSIPSLTLQKITDDAPASITTESLFGGRKVVVFGVPGAFTPTCTRNHLPGFVENRETIRASGIDEIVCVSVNDHHVMKAWAKDRDALGKITFIADWDCAFTKALGLDADLSAGGLGVRSLRYSMIVDDGAVTALNLEDNPGQATVSGAAALLEMLGD